VAEIRKSRKHETSFEDEFTSARYLHNWRGRRVLLEIPPRRGINTRIHPIPTGGPRPTAETFRAIAKKLSKEHPAISTDAQVLGGTPHLKNTRLSVGTVLAKLYLYGTIQAVLDIYSPHLSEEQVKAAIAYAQDFLEIACDPNEP
jgi:uncharacterized protein (DUF433 family)